MTEPWLRGPVPGIEPLLMPAAHALMQSREDLERAVADLDAERLWARPGGVASIGFHLRHIPGSIDRLLTYARGEQLGAAQRSALDAEQASPGEGEDARTLLARAQAGIDAAIGVIRETRAERLLEPREVGRARLQSTVLGLLFHIAEHTQRHVGQAIATAKIVRGLDVATTATPRGSDTPSRP